MFFSTNSKERSNIWFCFILHWQWKWGMKKTREGNLKENFSRVLWLFWDWKAQSFHTILHNDHWYYISEKYVIAAHCQLWGWESCVCLRPHSREGKCIPPDKGAVQHLYQLFLLTPLPNWRTILTDWNGKLGGADKRKGNSMSCHSATKPQLLLANLINSLNKTKLLFLILHLPPY